jgi:hypothetical protein
VAISFDAFFQAIAGQESGGNYRAVNKSSGALGKYQIMPRNVPSWSRRYLGKTITPSQFLASPKLQDQLARAVLGDYFKRFGPEGAAATWYSGSPKRKNDFTPLKNGSGPSVGDYVRQVLARVTGGGATRPSGARVPGPTLQEDKLAEYGFALSFLQSNPELFRLFKQAVAGNWDAAKFQARLKSTGWYKKNGDAARQWALLQKSDPATAAQRSAQVYAQVKDAAAQMGSQVVSKTISAVAINALRFNWNDNQIREVLAKYVHNRNGAYAGAAATDAEALKQSAWRNGINIPSSTIQKWVQGIAAGNMTKEGFIASMRKQATSLAPMFADELGSGMDLYDIAQPYIASAAKILEKNPATLDLFDPRIRGALSAKGADGKPASKSIWQFEQDLRKDPEWLKTQNAQDSLMTTGRKVLQDFGFKF